MFSTKFFTMEKLVFKRIYLIFFEDLDLDLECEVEYDDDLDLLQDLDSDLRLFTDARSS